MFKGIKMKFNFIVVVTLLLTLLGCQTTNSDLSMAQQDKFKDTASHHHFKKNDLLNKTILSLSTQLFLLDKFDHENKVIAVTNFVWADTLTTKQENNVHKFLEYYLADSLKVEFVQHGCNVIEYQSPSSLLMTNKASYFLSRNLKDLPEDVYMDYILVGTLLEVDNGVMANAEVIDIKTKEIVASAKEYIPTVAFHEGNKVVLKNNLIYRDSVRK